VGHFLPGKVGHFLVGIFNRYLRSFYERLKVKKGSGKAIIATTRKMLDIIYDTLKNDWEFKDFNNFVLV